MARGSRESHWLVIRRCLAIVRRAQRGPTDWHGLVQAVLDEEGRDAYGKTDGQNLLKRLHNDLAHIRRSLHIDLRADPKTKEYIIQGTDRPLLELPDDDLSTIAWLEQNFNTDSPRHKEVRTLMERLRSYLSPASRRKIEQHRSTLLLHLGQRDEDKIRREVEEGLQEALINRRRIEFDYLSPRYEDNQPRRHVVDVYEPYYFDAVRGHYYLRGWCHYREGPQGRQPVRKYIFCRLGRILKLRVLPQKLPPYPPPVRLYKVKYRLAPEITRAGVTHQRWIKIEHIEWQPDESAIISGKTESIFWAIHDLLHYREKCQVLGGPEMLQEMHRTAQEMSHMYLNDDPE